jgi:hypothetical protein
MTMHLKGKLLPAVLVAALAAASPAASLGAPLTEHELTALKAVQGIVRLFEESGGPAWPGFDLSKRPFLVYIPGKWALLVNPPAGAAEFGPLPGDWPALGIKAGYHAGSYRDFVGQLAFDLEVGGAKVVALGLLEGQFEAFGPKTATLLGFIVHEAFHQYQNETFGDIPWEREERYPILDADNSGLAALEMRILARAVAASLQGRREEAEAGLRQFVAVRSERWAAAPPFVARYEQGQEIREGTAAYVEKKSLDLVRGLAFDSALSRWTTPLAKDLEPLPAADLFRRDFEARTTDGAVSPDDMIRNRIYPLGSALGFLADLWGPDWKEALVRGIGTFAFHAFFLEKLGLRAADLPPLAADAKTKHDYPAIRDAAAGLIAGYRAGFDKDLAVFEAQAGTRVEIRLRYRSISRSRSSQGRSWVVDDGGRSLHNKVRVYALKTDGFSLQVKDAAVLETNDWDGKDKSVAFFTAAPPEILIDGAKREPRSVTGTVAFKDIALTAPDLAFSAQRPGRISVEKGRIAVEFPAPASK